MMRSILGSLIVLFVCVGLVMGEPAEGRYKVPTQMIMGAGSSSEPIPPGEMAILSISPIQGEYPGLKKVEYKWKILENYKDKTRVVYYPDNIQCFFGTSYQSTNIEAIVAVSYRFETKDKDGKVTDVQVINDVLYARVYIGNSPNPPPVPPGPNPPIPPVPPNPNPQPVFPDGQFSLAKNSWQFATDEVKLPSSEKERGAKALSNSFNSVKARVAAGVIKTSKDMLIAAKESNDLVLDTLGQRAAWESFGEKLQNYMYQLYVDKKLVTLDQYVVAFSEISLGLQSVK